MRFAIALCALSAALAACSVFDSSTDGFGSFTECRDSEPCIVVDPLESATTYQIEVVVQNDEEVRIRVLVDEPMNDGAAVDGVQVDLEAPLNGRRVVDDVRDVVVDAP